MKGENKIDLQAFSTAYTEVKGTHSCRKYLADLFGIETKEISSLIRKLKRPPSIRKVGRPPSISEDKRTILFDGLRLLEDKDVHIARKDLAEVVKEATEKDIRTDRKDAQWFNRESKKYGFSWKRNGRKVKKSKADSTDIEAVNKFYSELYRLKFKQEGVVIHVMDEKGVDPEPVEPYGYALKGGIQAKIDVENKVPKRFTLVQTISDDGSRFSMFLDHNKKSETDQPIAGITKEIMNSWVDVFLTKSKPGDVLVFDNLSSHQPGKGEPPEFWTKLEKAKINVLPLPPWMAIYMSPLNNYFFGQFDAKWRYSSTRYEENAFDAAIQLLNDINTQCCFEECDYPSRLRNETPEYTLESFRQKFKNKKRKHSLEENNMGSDQHNLEEESSNQSAMLDSEEEEEELKVNKKKKITNNKPESQNVQSDEMTIDADKHTNHNTSVKEPSNTELLQIADSILSLSDRIPNVETDSLVELQAFADNIYFGE